ncbi:M42 family metallopeptidase [Anaeromicropila herbilytica]|uniref:Cellulase n=1 Tax=Anaeromicropila herbilytica TaxID=2785025 RepID=A0A7R7ICJ7_9FIRM|nr:M42 family metallopeptidase [Anaeromicropila herbilytica]BCN30004.1 cellulase [Anaeromicropila herbilytica]
MEHKYKEYMLQQLENLLSIDSPTGYHYNIQNYLVNELTQMGYQPETLRKGGVKVNLGGERHPIMMLSHTDTLGCVVKYIKGNGRLAISNMTLNPNNIETETVKVITRNHGSYEGTIQLSNASVHVNKEVNTARDFDNLEIVLDEDVKSVDDVKALGINPGDFIAVNPRYTVTSKEYIKSRFLDDKASAAVLITFAKMLKEESISLSRNVWLNFTSFEEIGHGGATGIPVEMEDLLSVDMGCVGENITCTEKMVSICAKDSGGPYHYEFTNELIEAAKRDGVDYAIDVYNFYGSDVECSLRAGYDVRYALIGPGVYASHGYERTHVDGMLHTLDLIKSYLVG